MVSAPESAIDSRPDRLASGGWDTAYLQGDEWGGHASVAPPPPVAPVGQDETNLRERTEACLSPWDGNHNGFEDQIRDRYVQEFAGRHNARPMDTLVQMAAVVRGFEGKRLTYASLTS